MNKTAAAGFAAGAVLGSLVMVGSSGQAAVHTVSDTTGSMSYGEWATVTAGRSQARVEGPNTCACTGFTVRTWTHDGVQHKKVAYADEHGDISTGWSGASVNYALVDGVWRTASWIGWTAEGSLLKFKYDAGVNNTSIGVRWR